MSDVSKSLFIATILFTSMPPAMVFSQEPSPNKTGNVAEVHDSLSTEPTSILIMRPELDSLRTMAAAIVARNKHIRIEEPGTASGEPKQLEAELWLQPEVPIEIVEQIIGDVAKFGIVRIQLFLPFHDPDNTVVITAPANTPQRIIEDLQTNLALPNGFKSDIRIRDNEPSPSITPAQEIQSQITQLEVELAVQKLKLGAEHPSIKSLEERIVGVRKAEESEPRPPVTVLPLRHAKAIDVAEKIKLLDFGPVDGIVADERTNSLMIRGTEQQIRDIEQLLEILDAEDSSKTHETKRPDGLRSRKDPFGGGRSPFGGGGAKGRSSQPGSQPPTNQSTNDSQVRVSIETSPDDDRAELIRHVVDGLADTKAINTIPRNPSPPGPGVELEMHVLSDVPSDSVLQLFRELLELKTQPFRVKFRQGAEATDNGFIVTASAGDKSADLILAYLKAQSTFPSKFAVRVISGPTELASETAAVESRIGDSAVSVSDRQLRIFHLENSVGNEAAKIVEQLFGSPAVAIAVDDRTNSLIIRAEESCLTEIEAVLQRLDKQPAVQADSNTQKRQSNDKSNPLSDLFGESSNTPGTSIAEYRRRLADLETPVLQLAEKVRAAETTHGKDHPDAVKQRAELRALVQKTFAERQEIQRAELAEFTRRLQRMQQAIETRERIEEKIVVRRVEELLNPNIRWTYPQSSAGASESPVASNPQEPINIEHNTESESAEKEIVTLTLFEVSDAAFLRSDITSATQTAAPKDFGKQFADMLKNKTAKLIGKHAIETRLNQLATFHSGGTFEVPASTPQSQKDVEFGTTIRITPGMIAEKKAFDINWNERVRDFNNVVSGIPGIKEQQVRLVVVSPRPGGSGYLIGPLAGSNASRQLFIHFFLDSSPNVTPPSRSQAEYVQIRLRCNHPMSLDSGDVVFADEGRVAIVSPMLGVPMGFNFVEGDHRGPYQLTFERNDSSEVARTWLRNNVLPVEFLAEDQEQAASGQLVAKVIYLKSGSTTAETLHASQIETISSHNIEAGVDPVSVAAEKGTVIGVVRISKGAIRSVGSDSDNRPPRSSP